MKIYEVVVEKPRITSDYGYRINPISKKKQFHNGIDLISTVGNKDLYAIDDGYVQKVVTGQDKSTTGYGNYIWVRYPRYDLSLLHAHCSKVLLKKGDSVKKGTKIAIMGSTGASTGTHLHLGMTRIGSDAWLDPKDYNILEDKFNLTRLLKSGCKGMDVAELQKELAIRGYDLGKYGIDGNFGGKNSYTTKAVKRYQKDNGLTSDGIVGKNTAHALGWYYKGN